MTAKDLSKKNLSYSSLNNLALKKPLKKIF